jgi:hypothetical protein
MRGQELTECRGHDEAGVAGAGDGGEAPNILHLVSLMGELS